LVENVSWDIYPIYYDRFRDCGDTLLGGEVDEQNRQNQYANATNGWAYINFLDLNKDAECFN
jgi:hypothetical protein